MSTRAVSVSSVKSRSSTKRGPRLVSRSKESRVDELLFGEPARNKQMSGNRQWSEPGGGNWMFGSSATPSTTKTVRSRAGRQRSDVVEVITKDLIRTLKIPSIQDPSGMSVVLTKSDLDRIKRGAVVLTDMEMRDKEQAWKEERTKRQDDSKSRRQAMQELELSRKKHEKPSDLEQEAAEKGTELLTRAKVQMEEQEDEIKKLNELILNAKCHAIRDAQLMERDEISKAMKEEEDRLDVMMEIERLRALQEYDQKEKQRQLERLMGAKVLQQQITEREQARALEEEKRDQETQALLRYLDRLQQEDLDNLHKKRQSQKQLMEEVSKCNEEIKRQKALQREQLKLEDLRIIEYMKEKEKREEEQQKELERQKIEKEKELARLRAQQEQAKDKQAERDALRAKRNQEQFEREWRRKQREEAQKRAETEEMLRVAREDQVKHKEHFLAVQAQRDRTEFERVLKIQREQMERDRQAQLKAESRRKSHAEEVRKQVKLREEQLIQSRQDYFQEGIKLDQEARDRRCKLDAIKQRKLAELREAGIPEKYCAEVSRRITAPPPSITS